MTNSNVSNNNKIGGERYQWMAGMSGSKNNIGSSNNNNYQYSSANNIWYNYINFNILSIVIVYINLIKIHTDNEYKNQEYNYFTLLFSFINC